MEKAWGEASYWSVIGGEVGNLAFMVRFESFEAYGRSTATMFADPAIFARFKREAEIAKRLQF